MEQREVTMIRELCDIEEGLRENEAVCEAADYALGYRGNRQEDEFMAKLDAALVAWRKTKGAE